MAIRTVPVKKDSGPAGPQGPAGGGANFWIDLFDTDPTSFTSFKGHVVKVNDAEDGLDFSVFPIFSVDFSACIDVVNAVDVVIGQPLYSVSGITVDLAKADAVVTSRVIGLAITSAISPGPMQIKSSGFITKTNWTLVTGSISLTPGSPYFLDESTAGMLTTTSPSGSGETVVQVGMAASPTDLSILIQPPILLA